MGSANKRLKAADIKYIVAHCSAGPRNATAESIINYHQNKWPDQVGASYAYIIEENGAVKKGRDELSLGYHVGNLNSQAIGFCATGGVDLRLKEGGWPKPVDNFTDAQRQSIAKVALDLCERYPGAKLIGHNEVCSKACPVYDVHKIVETFGITSVVKALKSETEVDGEMEFWRNVKNFNSSEFECEMNQEFVKLLDKARDIAGFPFVIRQAHDSMTVDIRALNGHSAGAIMNACMQAGIKQFDIGKNFIRASGYRPENPYRINVAS